MRAKRAHSTLSAPAVTCGFRQFTAITKKLLPFGVLFMLEFMKKGW